MFLKKDKVKHGDKIYTYYKIVEAYRDENGKPRHKVIQNLGTLSDSDAEKINTVLSIKDDCELVLAKSSDIIVKRHWLFLPIIILHSVWRMFKLDDLFTNPLLVEAMVINRCIEPCSKIQVVDWTNQTILPALHKRGVLPEEYAPYRELDNINKLEVQLQSHLYNQLKNIDTTLEEGFFYDITSTYMEGSQCVIAKFGYSRDHRPDLQQIVIALMVTPNGSPFYWKVLDGNTQDVTTLPSVVNDLKKRFGLKCCHLVFDRGMVSAEHLDSLDDHNITYLTAMDKDEIGGNPLFNEFMPQPVALDNYQETLPLFEFNPTDDTQNFYTREGHIDNRRYIFSLDVVRLTADRKNRDKRMSQVFEWISEKNKSLLAAKKSRKRESLERDIKELLNKRKLKNVIHVIIAPIELSVASKKGTSRVVHSFQLSISIDKNNEAKTKRLDGITCFITNVSDFTHGCTIQKYRDKNKIEEAFREMKSILALRPIYLTREERVRAHISVCVLAYLLMNTMEMLLKKENCMNSPVDVLNKVKQCQLNEVGFSNSSDSSIVMTQITEQQKQFVELLKCGNFLKPKSLKIITDFMKKSL